jgi:hypothetical protein
MASAFTHATRVMRMKAEDYTHRDKSIGWPASLKDRLDDDSLVVLEFFKKSNVQRIHEAAKGKK